MAGLRGVEGGSAGLVMAQFPTLTLTLPAWVADLVGPGAVFAGRESRMRLAIDLAAANVGRGTGGPFGAAVFERDGGRVVAVGVHLVEPSACSLAHAEAMAVMLAQRSLGTHNLAAPALPPLELVCSAQPCCQCFGVIWWSGVRGLVVGARAGDVEAIAGFREGPLPDDWAGRLRHRTELPAVEVALDVLRDEALAPLHAFRASGRRAYDPGAGG
jgi:tRNA(Arg) A34 adenosine deaminase TadA